MKWSLYLALWTLSFCPAYAVVDLNDAIAATNDEIQKIQQPMVAHEKIRTPGQRMKIEEEAEVINSPSADTSNVTARSVRKPSAAESDKKKVESLYKELDAAQ